MPIDQHASLIAFTSDIASAYLRNNIVPANEVSNVIQVIHSALSNAHNPSAGVQQSEKPTPAVPVKKSVSNDAIICLDCGKPMKVLKRHLRIEHDTTIEQYRARWGLPPDYPIVAPNYAQARSDMAKSLGLGQHRKK